MHDHPCWSEPNQHSFDHVTFTASQTGRVDINLCPQRVPSLSRAVHLSSVLATLYKYRTCGRFTWVSFNSDSTSSSSRMSSIRLHSNRLNQLTSENTSLERRYQMTFFSG